MTISVVSHGQEPLVTRLLGDLAALPEIAQIVITRNIPESGSVIPARLTDRILALDNAKPMGFGANHNQAFQHCRTPYFCVLNPDIRLSDNPFPVLIDALETGGLGFVAPRVINPDGQVEDSARYYPTLPRLLRRRLLGNEPEPFAIPVHGLARPDWIAGMFLLFRASDYRQLSGFDEAYFLYCEDTDLCSRAAHANIAYAICADATAVHDARRASRRKLRYMLMHVRSMSRFLWRNGIFAAVPAAARFNAAARAVRKGQR